MKCQDCNVDVRHMSLKGTKRHVVLAVTYPLTESQYRRLDLLMEKFSRENGNLIDKVSISVYKEGLL